MSKPTVNESLTVPTDADSAPVAPDASVEEIAEKAARGWFDAFNVKAKLHSTDADKLEGEAFGNFEPRLKAIILDACQQASWAEVALAIKKSLDDSIRLESEVIDKERKLAEANKTIKQREWERNGWQELFADRDTGCAEAEHDLSVAKAEVARLRDTLAAVQQTIDNMPTTTPLLHDFVRTITAIIDGSYMPQEDAK